MQFPKTLRMAWFFFAALMLAGCGTQGVQLEESTLLRFLEEKSGLIAYQAMDGNIYSINQAGEERTQLTDDVEGLPPEVIFGIRSFTWAPESDRLAYIGFTPENWTIDITDPKGEAQSTIYANNTTQPVYINWLPDGRSVSFLTASDPMANNGKIELSLHAVSAEGANAESVLLQGYPLYYSWEPGGNRALAHLNGAHETSPDARISILATDSAFERDLNLPPARFQTPAWSPDGTELLMAITDVQGRDVLVVTNLQGQIRRTVTEIETAVAFTWSPDARYVGYIESDRTRQGASGPMTVYDTIAGESIFTTEENLVHAFFWAPDSEEIVYFTQELVNEDVQGQGQLVAGLRIHFLNVKDREVRHLQFGPDAFVFQPTQQFLRFLSAFDQYAQSATIWSPNGEYIVLPAVTESQGVILAIAVSGGIQPRLLTDGVMAIWSWK